MLSLNEHLNTTSIRNSSIQVTTVATPLVQRRRRDLGSMDAAAATTTTAAAEDYTTDIDRYLWDQIEEPVSFLMQFSMHVQNFAFCTNACSLAKQTAAHFTLSSCNATSMIKAKECAPIATCTYIFQCTFMHACTFACTRLWKVHKNQL
jgi:hypothetical protein